jgi:O-acetyl-ADP-ribose deacetylase (regulator of RNase III)
MAGNNNESVNLPQQDSPEQDSPQHNTAETDNQGELKLRYAAGVSENMVTFRTGDITNFVMDAIVCPWPGPKPEFSHYSQLICSAAGPGLLAERRKVWKTCNPPGISVMTGSHQINTCKHIIHVREPAPELHPDEEYVSRWKLRLLQDCIKASLIMVVSLDCKTIAFPPLGIRNNVWPPAIAAEAVLKAVGEFRATSPFRDRLQEIIFLFDSVDDMEADELQAYRQERL